MAIGNGSKTTRASKAELLLREKATDEEGNLSELIVWKVPVSARYPEGVRYRLAFIRSGEDEPAVLYDNHHPKGHHRHIEGVQQPYRFLDADALLEDFLHDVSKAREPR